MITIEVLSMTKKKIILMRIFLFLSFLLFFSLLWVESTFSFPSINQIIFHMKFSSSNVDTGIIYDYIIKIIPLSLLSTLLVSQGINFIQKIRKNKKSLKPYYHHFCILTLVLSLIFVCFKLNIIVYFANKAELSDFYKANYTNPQSTNISFQKNKHNLIHIYLESIESSYLSKENGGCFEKSLMPELEQLALKHTHFSNTEKLGGALTLEGTQWTTASVIAQTSGITSSLSIENKTYDSDSLFLPGVYSLGEVLEKEGYYQEVIMGSDAHFAGLSNYYQQHGNYKIMDYNKAIEVGYIPQDYHVFWGYEDEKLFDIAKKEIHNISQKNDHFSIEIMTIDPHTPNGYVCHQCSNKYSEQYKNVIACQSHQVYEFVQWLQKQDFYKDTTIVITGDHKSMTSQLFTNIDSQYTRTPYNCIINPIVTTQNTKNRLFNVVDMYPTILASIGAKIDGDNLGIGTNLFSQKRTILEKYGLNYINKELLKTDIYYQRKLIEKE